jgi:hypothetical protein
MITNKQKPQTHQSGNTGLLILQWLTYAFWGWTIFFTSMLASNVLSHYMTQGNDDISSLYVVSGVLLLLPISVLCNWLYTKQEPVKKVGAASLILIIHAVLFALFSIGALTVVIFSLLQLLINSGDTSSIQITLYSGIIVASLYSILFLRTINPEYPRFGQKYFLATMVTFIGTALIFGFVGPVNSALVTRDDRLIDNNLYQIQSEIDSYVMQNKQLPDSLEKLKLSGDTKIIVDRELLTYMPNEKSPIVKEDITTYYYQLCATYVKANIVVDSYSSPSIYNESTKDEDGYSPYQDFDHPAGEYCYKLSSVYDSSSPVKR